MLPTVRASDWSVAALARVRAGSRLGTVARALDPGFHVVPRGYDGQFYWGVAVDPLATGAMPAALDKPSYRYGHPLYAWVARLVAFTRARWVAAALAFVGLASLAAVAALGAAIGARGGRPWRHGLLAAVNPGLLVAAAHDLAEPLAAALLLGALAAHSSGRRRVAWLLCALLPLAKEPLVLVPLAVAAWELARRDRGRAAVVAASVLPALVWWVYLRLRLGAWFTSGATALTAPLHGWMESLGGPNPRHLSTTGAVVLALLLILLALTAGRALSRRGLVASVYLALLALVVCLAPNATWAFTTALRNVAFVLVLVPFVWLGVRRRA